MKPAPRWLPALLTTLGLCAPLSARAADCASNLLIVLDRSCSMGDTITDPMTGKQKTKWAIASAAIDAMTTKYKGKLRFGLSMFPDTTVKTPACVQGPNAIPPDLGKEDAIAALLAKTKPDGPCVTNIDEGMKAAQDEPAFKTTTVRSFVLLITDGMQSGTCNGGPTTADPKTVSYIQDLYNRKIDTYVVGFTASASPTSLNKFALAGGVPDKTGKNSFYLANSEMELDQILDTIGGTSAGDEFGCTGLPCPDGRCLDPGQMCVGGVCRTPPADLAGQPPPAPDAAAPGGDGGGGTGEKVGGCGCRAAQAGAPAPLLPGMLLLAGLALLRRLRGRADVQFRTHPAEMWHAPCRSCTCEPPAPSARQGCCCSSPWAARSRSAAAGSRAPT